MIEKTGYVMAVTVDYMFDDTKETQVFKDLGAAESFCRSMGLLPEEQI